MFTPQKMWSGWSISPRTGPHKSGTGSGSNQNSLPPNSNSGDGVKGKGIAFLEAAGSPASGLLVQNGAKTLVGSGEAATDRDGLAQRISQIENEVSGLYLVYTGLILYIYDNHDCLLSMLFFFLGSRCVCFCSVLHYS